MHLLRRVVSFRLKIGNKDVPENPLSFCLTAILSEDKCPLAQFSTHTSQHHLPPRVATSVTNACVQASFTEGYLCEDVLMRARSSVHISAHSRYCFSTCVCVCVCVCARSVITIITRHLRDMDHHNKGSRLGLGPPVLHVPSIKATNSIGGDGFRVWGFWFRV